jgi:hypothetical protein
MRGTWSDSVGLSFTISRSDWRIVLLSERRRLILIFSTGLLLAATTLVLMDLNLA